MSTYTNSTATDGIGMAIYPTDFGKLLIKNLLKPTGGNNCAASVSASLVVHIPIITYSGSNYLADLQYNSGDSTLSVSNAGTVSDMSPYSNCVAPSITSDFKLHIPVIILNSISYWVDLQYSNSVFVITGYGQN